MGCNNPDCQQKLGDLTRYFNNAGQAGVRWPGGNFLWCPYCAGPMQNQTEPSHRHPGRALVAVPAPAPVPPPSALPQDPPWWSETLQLLSIDAPNSERVPATVANLIKAANANSADADVSLQNEIISLREKLDLSAAALTELGEKLAKLQTDYDVALSNADQAQAALRDSDRELNAVRAELEAIPAKHRKKAGA